MVNMFSSTTFSNLVEVSTLRGRGTGPFPEQRLVVKPTKLSREKTFDKTAFSS